MDVLEFRSKIKPNAVISIGGRDYTVKEVVKFRFDDGNYYIKCFLEGGFVFADDLSENTFILVKGIKTPFKRPFPENLEFDGKNFKFLFSAHAVAEEIQGDEVFKKGESERFWDYAADDGSYLSLGINDQSGERSDDWGRIVNNGDVAIK
ncbi:MAG TPA: DUF4178 domain-containing protein [Candidatus Paceibacterota bacterium]|nr:DUF4178 domain-containing protein [Candidatus Pacearchaeota archaeon]HRZ51466.1 DUF4178 domain-containing protein [Candidatus Paceibacterota bacterium]HSA37192.1 DUF4178 domain-containing protein [Candidatus Paceibacterota bacterium]